MVVVVVVVLGVGSLIVPSRYLMLPLSLATVQMLSLQVGQLVPSNFSESVKIVGMLPPVEDMVSVVVVCLVINLYVSFLRRRAHNLKGNCLRCHRGVNDYRFT